MIEIGLLLFTISLSPVLKIGLTFYQHLYAAISVYDIYAKISVCEIKIGTLNAPLIFHHQIMFMNESWGQLLTTITQILVRLVMVAVKYVIF